MFMPSSTPDTDAGAAAAAAAAAAGGSSGRVCWSSSAIVGHVLDTRTHFTPRRTVSDVG